MNNKLTKLLAAGTTFVALLLTTSTYAQHCTTTAVADNGSSMKIKAGSGFSGSYSLPCAEQNAKAEIQVPFQTFSTIARGSNNDQVYKMRIDKITNIPSGMCWVTSKADNTFNGNEGGLLVFAGTTKDDPGQYNLQVTVSFDTDGDGTFDREGVNYNKISKTGKMILRVSDSSSACQPIDYDSQGNVAGISTAEKQ